MSNLSSKQQFYSRGKDVLNRESPCVVFAECAYAKDAALVAKLLNAQRQADETSRGRAPCDCKPDANSWMQPCPDKPDDRYCILAHQPCEHCPKPSGAELRQSRSEKATVRHAVTCKKFPDPYDERDPVGPCTCGAENGSTAP